MSTRLIIANFDAEIEMARAATTGPHPGLPAHVRRRLETASRALAVLDADATILTEVPTADAIESGTEVLAWAETASIEALRKAIGLGEADASSFDLGDRSWLDALWRLRGSAATTLACHDRRFWLTLAAERGELLPQTHLVTSLAELRAHLPAVVARSQRAGWIAKAPLSASGRERVYRWDIDFPGDIATRLERLFDRYGELILEPYMARVLDVGVSGLIDERGAHLFPPHRLLCDDAGVYRGIELGLDLGDDLDETSAGAIRAAADAAGDALFSRGHRGAFGIDAFLYTTVTGAIATHPMGEINARLTFGHLAHAAALA